MSEGGSGTAGAGITVGAIQGLARIIGGPKKHRSQIRAQRRLGMLESAAMARLPASGMVGDPSRVYATQQGGRSSTTHAQIALPDWRDALEGFAEGALDYWARWRAAKASTKAATKWQKRLADAFDALRTTPILYDTGGSMPYPVTSFVSSGGSGGGSWINALLGGLAGAAGGALGIASGSDLGYDVPYFPDILVPDVIQRGMATSGSVGSPWAAPGAHATATKFLLQNPQSGKLTWFGPLGEPVLWSRDFSAARKVRRVGMKARRYCGGGRRSGG